MSDVRTKALGFATRAIHATLKTPAVASKAIATPIFQTAAFSFEDVDGVARTLSEPQTGFMYSRVSNPTIDVLERSIADLESAEAGVAFGSGMAAIHAVFLALLVPGDHVVAPAAAYGSTMGLLKGMLATFGVTSTFVEGGDRAAWEAAITPKTKVVYAESISNPSLRI